MNQLRGKFIVFDGGEGCGKSTQARLLRQRLETDGLPVLPVHDPGATRIGDLVRGILLDPRNTDIKHAPWWVVEADDKRRARLNCIAHLLSLVEYEDLTPPPLELPPRGHEHYMRPPMDEQTFVPQRY